MRCHNHNYSTGFLVDFTGLVVNFLGVVYMDFLWFAMCAIPFQIRRCPPFPFSETATVAQRFPNLLSCKKILQGGVRMVQVQQVLREGSAKMSIDWLCFVLKENIYSNPNGLRVEVVTNRKFASYFHVPNSYKRNPFH